jgi:hypothetical protein
MSDIGDMTIETLGAARADTAALYRDELGRPPDWPAAAGVPYWLLRGASHEAMRAELRQSEEWVRRHAIPPPSVQPWPRIGLSYYASLTDPRVNLAEFFARLRDAGAGLTRTWLMDAWAIDQGGPGQYNGFVPFARNVAPDTWDLDRVRPEYLDRLRAYVEHANAAGIVPLLTGLELYTWSQRKAGLLWVPDQSLLWMQRNRQGVVYRDDDAFNTLGTGGNHGWLGTFYKAVVRTLDGLAWAPELGNEMPEKPLHYRLRDLWREAGYTGPISINRQEDTPGQFVNMRVGQDFEQIAFHGRRDMAYLDEVFEREPDYRTFRQFFEAPACDPGRITLSSDGCRKSTTVGDVYDYDALGAVFRDALARGFAIEHQSALKIRSFVEGRIDLADLETSWLRSLQ